MVALLSVDGQIGPGSFTIRRTIVLFVSAAIAAPILLRFRHWRTARWVGLIAALVLVARAPSVPILLVGFLLTLVAIQVLCEPGVAELFSAGVIPACLAYVGVRFASDLVPQANAIVIAVGEAASRYIGRARGTEVRMSFTALGGPAVAVAVLYLLASWRRTGGRRRLIVAAGVPVVWFALLPVVTPEVAAGPIMAFARGALHGLFWLAVATVVDAIRHRRPSAVVLTFRQAGAAVLPMPRLPLVAACLAATFAAMCLVGTALIGPAAGKSILVHNRGGLDWDRPVFGRFGGFSTGMFGLLPVYCRAEGYDFAVVDKDRIAPGDLERTQILVLINSPTDWKDGDRRTILDFVARGGSLLVLGDHTDVFGLMRGFNSLLGPLGIRFRFDSAYKARESWRGCQKAAADAVAWRWDDENPGVAVGASLELSGNARSLLLGRYAFSDTGARENFVGSFLGNYHYDRGEQLGDVVLVATVTYGRGRVVVWGDTSAFQGGLSSYYQKVVGPMLAWLSRPAAWTERPPVRIAAAIALLAVLLWLSFVPVTPKQVAAVSLSLLLGLAVPWALSLRNLDVRPHVDRDTILIDRSHMEATGHYEARVNPIGPLYTNLFRSGFRVFDIERWDSAAIGRARGVAFVAPQKSFTRWEVKELLRGRRRRDRHVGCGSARFGRLAPAARSPRPGPRPATIGNGHVRRADGNPPRAGAAASLS